MIVLQWLIDYNVLSLLIIKIKKKFYFIYGVAHTLVTWVCNRFVITLRRETGITASRGGFWLVHGNRPEWLRRHITSDLPYGDVRRLEVGRFISVVFSVGYKQLYITCHKIFEYTLYQLNCGKLIISKLWELILPQYNLQAWNAAARRCHENIFLCRKIFPKTRPLQGH